jgi:mannose-6-phosphate isomerase-like protein (cupin superfamily)
MPATIAAKGGICATPHKYLQLDYGFRVVLSNEHAQAAQMTLGPGGFEGGPDNRHWGADQWLYVVSGVNEAVVNGNLVEFRAGILLLIERGNWHKTHNTGREPLRTFNIHVPSAYTGKGRSCGPVAGDVGLGCGSSRCPAYPASWEKDNARLCRGERNVELHKRRSKNEIGKGGFSCEDGGSQPIHSRQGGPTDAVI